MTRRVAEARWGQAMHGPAAASPDGGHGAAGFFNLRVAGRAPPP